jgi:hypothetical protein
MTGHWTLNESRLIAERVMEWQVTEQNGRLFLTDPEQRPDWLETCAIPDWPRDPAAAAMALAALQMDGVSTWQHWEAEKRQYCVSLHHQHDARYPVMGEAREWSQAVMLAVLAAVRG